MSTPTGGRSTHRRHRATPIVPQTAPAGPTSTPTRGKRRSLDANANANVDNDQLNQAGSSTLRTSNTNMADGSGNGNGAHPPLRVKKKVNGLAAAAAARRAGEEDVGMSMAVDRDHSRHKHSHSSGSKSKTVVPFVDDDASVAVRSGSSTSKSHKSKLRTGLTSNGDAEKQTYMGGIAVAEFEKMKREVESLKKQLHEGKHAMQKTKKALDELKKENKERVEEVHQLKTKSNQTEEVLTTFETNLACSICLEVLLKPFALPPCGHVYCYDCLHDWFTHAPADQRERGMDEDDEDAVLRRKKTCPTCRGIVTSRPVPLFVVKSLAQALVKVRPIEVDVGVDVDVDIDADGDVVPGLVRPALPTAEDPWEGIFYIESFESTDEEGDSDDEVSDDDDDEMLDADDDSDLASDDDDDDNIIASDASDDEGAWGSEYGYGTGSDESAYGGDYVRPRWAPPMTPLDPAVYDLTALSPVETALLRRGASLAMVATFRMRYSHAHGISAVLNALDPGINAVGGAGAGANVNGRNRHIVYLGWNISLHPGDPVGTEYMAWIAQDLAERGEERWETRRNANGSVASWRLARAEEERTYETSDSEVYAVGVEGEEEEEGE